MLEINLREAAKAYLSCDSNPEASAKGEQELACAGADAVPILVEVLLNDLRRQRSLTKSRAEMQEALDELEQLVPLDSHWRNSLREYVLGNDNGMTEEPQGLSHLQHLISSTEINQASEIVNRLGPAGHEALGRLLFSPDRYLAMTAASVVHGLERPSSLAIRSIVASTHLYLELSLGPEVHTMYWLLLAALAHSGDNDARRALDAEGHELGMDPDEFETMLLSATIYLISTSHDKRTQQFGWAERRTNYSLASEQVTSARRYLLASEGDQKREALQLVKAGSSTVHLVLRAAVDVCHDFNPSHALKRVPQNWITPHMPRNLWVKYVANPAVAATREIIEQGGDAAADALVRALWEKEPPFQALAGLVLMDMKDFSRRLIERVARTYDHLLEEDRDKAYYRVNGLPIALLFVLARAGNEKARNVVSLMLHKWNSTVEEEELKLRNTVLNYLFEHTGD